ncbi:MAG TPA: hypothetical protein GXX64_09985 [Bacteroidales bacterium]|nr:hypothetical protein [Bacteroidales bacterium]
MANCFAIGEMVTLKVRAKEDSMDLIKCKTCNKETCPNCGAPNETVKFENKTSIRNILIIAVSIVVIIIAVTGCNSGMDSRVYDYGIDSLEVVDDYLDGEISATDAENKLEENYNKLEQLGKLADSDSTGLRTDELIIRTKISSVKWEITRFEMSSDGSSSDIINARNELAEKLNKKHR